MIVDDTALAAPERVAAVERARRVLPALAIPLDAIARLAADLAGTPMGVVTLVGGDQQHRVGEYGLPAALAGNGTAPLTYSVCKYIVLGNAPLTVDDMLAEPDLRGNGWAVEYGARAFMGTPLRDAAGQAVGSLSVVDTVPRRWTAAHLSTLQSVGALLGPIPVLGLHAGPAEVAGLHSASVLDVAVEAFVAIDAGGEIVGWNRAAELMFGWSAAEAQGRPFEQVVEPVYERGFGAPADTGPPTAHRALVRHRTGRRFPAKIVRSVVQGSAGALDCAFITDVSGEASAEADAARHQGFLGAVLDNLNAGVMACDARGRIVLLNRALREIQGLPVDWTQRDVADATATLTDRSGVPLDPDHIPLLRALRGEQIRDLDIEITAPRARTRTFVANAEPIRDPDGPVLGAVMALHEVTERRRAQRFRDCELEVAKALAQAGTAAEASPRIIEAVASTLGWPHAELWLIDEVTDTLRPASYWTARGYQMADITYEQIAKGEGVCGAVWATGGPVWVPDVTHTRHIVSADIHARAEAFARLGLHSALAVPVSDGDTMLGVLICFSDAPEHDEAEPTAFLTGIAGQVGQFLAHRRADELALQLARTKDDFLLLVGHEMRTPLTSIASYTELLLDQAHALPDPDRELVEVIGRNTAALRAIIDDLLDLAGLESGHLSITTEDVDLVPLISEATTGLPAADGVTVQTELPERVVVHGDPGRLRQVLDNLLSNAVKYSPDGGRVSVYLGRDGDAAELRVTDAGIGIPPEERHHLFQRFYRASNARTSGITGTGLGLTIVRTLVEAHAGTIALTDPADHAGTTITIRLPLAASSRGVAHRPD
ncbi:MAG TPA: ATP-binding protein [Micromonosporaceae bacterium]|nr:ATP-binding protein [Micromonosporaceae bacterium]